MIGENELPDDLTNLTTPQLDEQHFASIDRERLRPTIVRTHPPRILILYGSLRFFHPSGLPLVDDGVDASHTKVRELRDLVAWSEGMVWSSPERHGAMTGLMKTQIDWIPLSEGAVRPTQGKTLAVMQVSGGSQSFNAVNQMRLLGRWMRMLTIPNQSSVAKAFLEFDEAGRMKPSAYYDRIVDAMEELMKFTLLTRDSADYLVDRCVFHVHLNTCSMNT